MHDEYDDDELFDDEFDPDYKSKSQVKREFHALQELGRQLVESPRARIEDLAIEERTREAIFKARGLKKQAMKRQIQYLGGLLQHEDVDSLREYLEELDKPHKADVERFHELEVLRDQLLSGEADAVETVMQRFESADRQHLRQLVRNAQREAQKNQPPKSARILFKYLRELQENQV